MKVFWRTAVMGIGFSLVSVHGTFAETPLKERVLVKETVVRAAREDVWTAWTTKQGLEAFLAPRADIELRIGGKFEISFNPSAPEGQRGSEGCTVLSFLPLEMLSFTWNAPPTIPKLRESGARTHVIVYLEDGGPDEIKVRLAQLGFGEGEDWEKYYAYFDRAWGSVLGALKDQISMVAAPDKTDQVDARLQFQTLVAAPVADVWAAFTTKEGIEQWMVPLAEIDLRVGGLWRTNYNRDGSIGDPGTIAHRIMTYEPNRLLAFQTIGAPAGFPHAEAIKGTWAVVTMTAESPEKTKVRLASVGLGRGPAADAMVEFFQEGNRVTLDGLTKRFEFGEKK